MKTAINLYFTTFIKEFVCESESFKSLVPFLLSTQVCEWLKVSSRRKQHPTKHQLRGRLPPVTKTIQVRRTRHAGHCWRNRDEFISEELLWTPTYGPAKAGRPARTYIQQPCEDTGCNPEDLPEAMNDRKSGERGSGISVWAARHDDDDDDFYRSKNFFSLLLNMQDLFPFYSFSSRKVVASDINIY